jgi:hypothetical protein
MDANASGDGLPEPNQPAPAEDANDRLTRAAAARGDIRVN